MLSEIETSTLIAVVSLTFTGVIGVYITFINYIAKRKNNNTNKITRQEFEEHKKNVQYKDNCSIHVSSIKNGMRANRELFDAKLTAIESKLGDLVKQVCRLVKYNGERRS